VQLYEGTAAAIQERLLADAQAQMAAGKRVGLLVSDELAALAPAGAVVQAYGSQREPAEIGNRLYHCLRTFDQLAVDQILAEGVPETGLGLALMNRLRKASGYRIIYC